jgi:16S rRNA (cytidine1402-2'-O)-methyltransferase
VTIDPTLLQRAAHEAAAGQQHPAGTLYVVATPIGNLADITLRAIHVLGRVHAVACEDTRVAGQLLRHLGLHKPLLAAHAHNEREAAESVLARLALGESVAYISDAGTPAVSDPGAVLVQRAAAAGFRIVPLPGPSSALAALSVAGDVTTGGFVVTGFLPAKGGERRERLAALLADARTQVLFEAPHRVIELVAALAEGAPARRVTLCRELTKQFETIVTAAAADLPGWLAADPHRLRGEFVLVLHAQPAAAVAADVLQPEALRTLGVLMRELPLKQAVALAAELSGVPRRALYQRALKDRGSDGAEDSEGDENPNEREL